MRPIGHGRGDAAAMANWAVRVWGVYPGMNAGAIIAAAKKGRERSWCSANHVLIRTSGILPLLERGSCVG